MKHKKTFNAVIAFVLLCILCYLAGVPLWESPYHTLHQKQLYLTVLVLVFCIISYNLWTLDYRYRYFDRMSGINNMSWIILRGGILYFTKRIVHYDCVFVNIKDCKYINQKVTNANGDEVISIFALRMKLFLKKKGYVGRMGGDNFLVFIKDDYLEGFLEFIKNQQIRIFYNGRNELLNVSSRAGIYRGIHVTKDEYNDNGFRNIINRSAIALARAKIECLDSFVFEKEMIETLVKDTELVKDFHKGVKNKEFTPFYQPKVDAITRKLCGAEALVRWNKNGKIISPAEFIEVLERSGEVMELDYRLFGMVCEDIRGWLDRGMEPVRVSVNFSRLHLKDSLFADKIIEIRNQYRLDGKYIEIELTESTEDVNLVALKEFTKRMRAENISIAIDDFGTEYSSLSLIKNFDADVVKLDKSFIESATKDDIVGKNFVEDIIHMIEHLGITTLCEGVEKKEQLDFLVKAGCGIIQGFYFDEALPREVFEDRLLHPVYDKEIA